MTDTLEREHAEHHAAATGLLAFTLSLIHI